MKKILFLLLLTSVAYGQVPADASPIENVQITNNVISTTAPFINAQETTGVVNKINKADLIDVIEVSSATTLPTTGVAGKIYVTSDNNRMYRWAGTFYSELFLSKEDKSNKGIANGYASLDANGKVPLIQINDVLLGSVNYKGTYNAATNTPTLPVVASGNKGHYFIVSTAGTQVGLTLQAGDWIISNGEAWGKVDNNNAVTSVNGLVGSVVLTTANVADSANKRYQTDTQQTNNDATSPIQAQINGKQPALSGTANVIPKFGTGGLIGSNIFDNGTNVGIGTISPAAKLDVRLNSTSNDAAAYFINASGTAGTSVLIGQDTTSKNAFFGYFGSGSGTFRSLIANTAYFGSSGGASQISINANGAQPITFNTSDWFERMRIIANGNVLINTTTDNTVDKLQVNGTISASPATLSNQTVVKSQLDAITNNTALTGVPTAPTAAAGTNTTQLATTAFVNGASGGRVPYTGATANVDLGNNDLKARNLTAGLLYANAVEFNEGFGLILSGSGSNYFKGFTGRWQSDVLLKYATDLSASYDARTLVDKGYVDARRPYKVYSALLSQSGVTAPTAIVLENGLGTVSYTYVSAGNYDITIPTALSTSKIMILMHDPRPNWKSAAFATSLTNIRLKTVLMDSVPSPLSDAILLDTSIEIRVYN